MKEAGASFEVLPIPRLELGSFCKRCRL